MPYCYSLQNLKFIVFDQKKLMEDKKSAWKVAKAELIEAKRRKEEAQIKYDEAKRFKKSLNEVSRELFMKQASECTKQQRFILRRRCGEVNKEFIICSRDLMYLSNQFSAKRRQEEKARKQKTEEPGKIAKKIIGQKLSSIYNSLFSKNKSTYEKLSGAEIDEELVIKTQNIICSENLKIKAGKIQSKVCNQMEG